MDRKMTLSAKPNPINNIFFLEYDDMPGVLRFGKRGLSLDNNNYNFDYNIMPDEHRHLAKKEMPGVLRFGKRLSSEKKDFSG